MSSKKEGNRELIIELAIVGVALLASFAMFKLFSSSIIGFVPGVDQVLSDVDVEDEVDSKMLEAGEVDVIVEFVDKQEGKDALKQLSNKEFNEKNSFRYFNGAAGKIDKDGLEKIRKNSKIKKIYLDRELRIDLQDSTKIVKANSSWLLSNNNVNITGKGSVCIIDTGVDYNHPSLSANYLGGYDYVNDDNDPKDDNGHGTHVAGIVAGNGSIKGVAPSAKIIAIKVCNSGGGCSVSDVSSGIEWCANNKSIYDINVISMSLGGGLFTSNCDSSFPSMAAAVDAAVSNGISVFAASGNSGSVTSISAPACLVNAIAVGGSDKSDNMYTGGNRNSLIGVIAPAVGITSSYLNNGQASLTGTSMATPHAAAVANLLQHYSSLNGNSLNPGEIKSVMQQYGKQINDAGSGLSYRRVDAYSSLISLDDNLPEITVINPVNNTITPKKFAFVNITSDEKLTIALLQWKDANYSMNGGYKVFSKNITNISGVNNYYVFGYDVNNNIGKSVIGKLTLESKKPNVSLNVPGDDQAFNNKKIEFSFAVSDDVDESLDCSLNIDMQTSSMNVANNSNYNINKTLSDGLHVWNVSCQDSSSNIAYSNNWELNIDAGPLFSNNNPNGAIFSNNANVSFLTDESSYCRGSFNANNSINDMEVEFGTGLMHDYILQGDYRQYNVYIACNDSNSNTAYYNWQFSLEETTTTAPGSSGGGSSGSSGSSGSQTSVQPVSQPTSQEEQQVVQEVIPQPVQEEQQIVQEEFPLAGRVTQEETINNNKGIMNLVGNSIRNAGTGNLAIGAIVAGFTIYMLFYLRKFLGFKKVS